MDSLSTYGDDSIRQGSNSFAKAARLFDPATRRSVTLLYAWCRFCDDMIDGQEMGHGAQMQTPDKMQAILAGLRRETDRVYDGGQPTSAAFAALAEVLRHHPIPRQHLHELLDGFAMDATATRFETMEDTLRYCYHVAGVVGVMMARIMGVEDPAVIRRAADLGIAFQLTNIARDVMDDWRIGRCYLPEEGLRRFGCERESLDPERDVARLHGLACELLTLADGYYDSARIGIAFLPWRSGWAIASALNIYRDIGVKVMANGPQAWDGRTWVSNRRKVWHLVGGSVAATRARVHRNTYARLIRPNMWTAV